MRYIEISLIKNTTAMTTSVNYINVLSQTFVKFILLSAKLFEQLKN